jgi:hypothetical protein
MKTQEIQSHMNYISDYCKNSLKFKAMEKRDKTVKVMLKNLSRKIKSKF